jgi:hypothetical protein
MKWAALVGFVAAVGFAKPPKKAGTYAYEAAPVLKAGAFEAESLKTKVEWRL